MLECDLLLMRVEQAEEMSEDDDRSLPLDLGGGGGGGGAVAESASKTRNCTGCYGDIAASGSVENTLHNVLENVLHFLTSRHDRNAASLVCKSWCGVEALTRSELFIGNCYAVSPRRVTSRFKRVRSVTIKGRPRFSDFNLMPPNWGAHFTPWVAAMAKSYPWLERIYLKRMSVTDDDLALLAESFPGFKELVLFCCEGFGTSGIAVVASRCRYASRFHLLLFVAINIMSLELYPLSLHYLIYVLFVFGIISLSNVAFI